ncbi:citrate (pro-3S)-lyase] ligase [Desulfuromonas versatilis]|uniref:Citrate (Pro-3S)-lyase] ligase n=1 Tax=Desulfuromonas versatilis TaxID=2802975 RepID=A0ABM8HU72_9BACT|nr:adenylyltransferase/cytidyltransferase family protein [Desulfuromonas versatilis]BCR05525.1 citrate (pro-3S)-lyase] ligase [Desulfuromonas versatilis]
MVVELIGKRDYQLARQLIEGSGLTFEQDFDNLVGVFEGGRLVAVAARSGRILKMFAIDPDHQSGSLLGELVTEQVRLGTLAGLDTFFVFTPPTSAPSFQALNFTPLVRHHEAFLLEYGNGLGRYLEDCRPLLRPGANGAVVVNCNPFTLGHRYLIEEAAGRVDTLYVFVVREDRSIFPFETRFRLVREGVRDLENVVVLDSSHYAVSGVTFPSYFLKDPSRAASLQMEIDLTLFGRHLAPFFQVAKRFVGSEPFCRTTRLYSEEMFRVLAAFGVETVQLERREAAGEVISAYRVRDAIRREAYETVRRLVPPSTLAYLLSDEARELREKLKTHHRRH